MYHFFVTPEQVMATEIQIEGSDVNHIKNVLRMKNGEELQQYLCFRKRGSIVENKKKNKKYVRKNNKDICRNMED